VRPVTSTVVEPAVIEIPPGCAVITYCVIADPPLSLGGLKVTVAFVSPRTTEVKDGAPGGPTGVTVLELAEGEDAPAALFATTVNEYEDPLLSPETVQLVEPTGTLHVAPPGEAVTVYPVMAEPPLSVGGVKETRALPLPSTAETDVGDCGTVAGVAVTNAVEDSESPTPFVAMTRKVYSTPFVRPNTVIGELLLVPVKPPGSAITV
jgi:hypothetical protein